MIVSRVFLYDERKSNKKNPLTVTESRRGRASFTVTRSRDTQMGLTRHLCIIALGTLPTVAPL
ncbi:hypothetical protein E2C01_038756 [Portunus trituberculatus]|uniref:Uncharacterized protein n=1 Tax=Portunus trituberculatus TaxID=210409 RepID=A0A5B7FD13_PORTR|nr:hypothetical protein [Portunus trituberculatus]